MQKIELTVHEFMSIMGTLSEAQKDTTQNNDTIYEEWFTQWKGLDERLEKLEMMERADMLFDGKVSINAISEPHFLQLIGAVKDQISFQKSLIDKNDEDADPEDLEMWVKRLAQLNNVHSSSEWSNQN